ncbi:RNA polymerase sigma factor [Winogradskyella luteola]|uniref:RNA polymerase sigma factor n=1 Tax=Winogradskyella luteola TaxID=2828330 RepID=A0A9X1JRB8_9FLAO|nr:RNA polymerase sigma factor [Winogradskyella luteola]MBV7270729.1 RNA polymerase sigma factor [Winogradskyella luteola]
MKTLTDEELMELIVGGNLDMMRHLFQRYHIKIYNFCWQMTKDKDLSKDITQEVFYKVIKHRKTYRQNKFSSWIYAIARNLCKDHYKILNKTERLNDKNLKDTYSINDNRSEPLGNISQLNFALDQLSNSDRELIVMGKYQGLKYYEIAKITDSTLGAVKTKMHRAMQKLKDSYFLKTKHHEL